MSSLVKNCPQTEPTPRRLSFSIAAMEADMAIGRNVPIPTKVQRSKSGAQNLEMGHSVTSRQITPAIRFLRAAKSY